MSYCENTLALLACAFGLQACDALRASRIFIINNSGQGLRDVTVTTGEHTVVIAAVAAGAEVVVNPKPSDSEIIRLSFECSGRTRVISDCGCIDSVGETRKITILPGGTSVEIDFGMAGADREETTDPRVRVMSK
jgi:hypothetical protein